MGLLLAPSTYSDPSDLLLFALWQLALLILCGRGNLIMTSLNRKSFVNRLRGMFEKAATHQLRLLRAISVNRGARGGAHAGRVAGESRTVRCERVTVRFSTAD